jgi:hypothetical protein
MVTNIQCRTVCFLLLPEKLNIRIYRNEILSVVLYECRTWPLRVMEKQRLNAHKKGVDFGLQFLNSSQHNFSLTLLTVNHWVF